MNHKAYWRYQFLRDWPLLLILLAIEVLFDLIALLSNITPAAGTGYEKTFFVLLLYPSFFIAYIFPLFHKSKLWNRRAVDLYLGLPLDKKGIYLDDLFLGLVELIGILLISFSWGILVAPLSGNHAWILPADGGYALLFALLATITGYLLSSGIVSCANNAFDATVFLALFILGQAALSYDIGNNLRTSCAESSSLYYSCPSQTDYVLAPLCFYHALLDNTYDSYHLYNTGAMPVWVIIVHVLSGIIFAILGYFLSKNWKSEKAQTPSRAWYNYPLFSAFPFTFLIGLEFPYFFTSYNWTVPLVLFAVGTLLYWILIFIGERKIRFRWNAAYIYLGAVASGYLLAFLLWKYA